MTQATNFMQSSKSAQEFENLMEAFLLELIDMPDEQILEGTTEQESLAWGRRLLDAAQKEAGQRRMAAARERLKEVRSLQPSCEQEIDEIPLAEARSYLARISQDSRYTMAARKLGELSSEEVLRLYKQMRSLELVLVSKGWSS
jgi:uncharacterized protein (DUF885 family)